MLALHPKSQGRGLMVSDFITLWFLRLSSEEQQVAKLSHLTLLKVFSSLALKEMATGILFPKLIE